MKKHSLKLEIPIFCIIFFTFILSPIINQFLKEYNNIFITWNFSFDSLIYALIAVILNYFYKEKQNLKPVIYKIILPASFCFCILFCISLLIKFFSLILPFQNNSSVTDVNIPESFLAWLFCILKFFFAAFFEETIYRFYFPEFLLFFVKNSKTKIQPVIIEVLCIVFFASAHIYLGMYAVINAIIAHIVLRFTFKKTNSIIPGFVAHTFYNIISLILL